MKNEEKTPVSIRAQRSLSTTALPTPRPLPSGRSCKFTPRVCQLFARGQDEDAGEFCHRQPLAHTGGNPCKEASSRACFNKLLDYVGLWLPRRCTRQFVHTVTCNPVASDRKAVGFACAVISALTGSGCPFQSFVPAVPLQWWTWTCWFGGWHSTKFPRPGKGQGRNTPCLNRTP
jgi:hypothetical protein